MENKLRSRVRELRLEKGMTQLQLAEMLGKTGSAPRMWELGKAMPDAVTIIKLAEYFDCSTDYLLGVSDFRREKDKIEYFHTEKVLIENLSKLNDIEKECLIHSINHVLNMHNSLSKYGIDSSVYSAADILKMIALMMEEVNIELIRFREGNKDSNMTDDMSKQTFTANINCMLKLFKLKEDVNSTITQNYIDLLLYYVNELRDNVSPLIQNINLMKLKR